MTATALDRYARQPGQVATQAAAVEQARAVAEVQAAVVVAQQMPRDIARAEAEMRDACGRLALAGRAFYSVPNRGNGPSVHLARELARIWGNVDHGVHELRRDDQAGMSEVRAFAWDQQTNTRSTRTFQAPHERMKGGNRQKLTDLGDIYLSNQNVGARAVRECIFTVLPAWFTETAQDLCRQTLENGEGVPLADRIGVMVDKFALLGVTQEQIEQKVGRKKGQWSAADVAEMAIVYTSITRDGLDKDELFPARRVTADDIKQGQPARPQRKSAYSVAGNRPAGDDQAASPKQVGEVARLCAELGMKDDTPEAREETMRVLSVHINRDITSRKQLTAGEASQLIDRFRADVDARQEAQPQPDEPTLDES